MDTAENESDEINLSDISQMVKSNRDDICITFKNYHTLKDTVYKHKYMTEFELRSHRQESFICLAFIIVGFVMCAVL
jgi:hypothetical protein